MNDFIDIFHQQIDKVLTEFHGDMEKYLNRVMMRLWGKVPSCEEVEKHGRIVIRHDGVKEVWWNGRMVLVAYPPRIMEGRAVWCVVEMA